MRQNFACVSSHGADARKAHARLSNIYRFVEPEAADVLIVLGGDGFMLRTMHAHLHLNIPFYGMNRGTVGFLLNEFDERDLIERVELAEEYPLHPLHMQATDVIGKQVEAVAFNEVALLRQSQQSAHITVRVNNRVRIDKLVCDGVMVSTPAGSTAYNFSAHGPIIPLGSNVLALTPVSPFRPRRWNGALLPHSASVTFEIQDANSRPVGVSADSFELSNVASVHIRETHDVSATLLFDRDHSLEERILNEQFTL